MAESVTLQNNDVGNQLRVEYQMPGYEGENDSHLNLHFFS